MSVEINNQKKGIEALIKKLRFRQRLTTVSGLTMTVTGIVGSVINLVSPHPETISNYSLDIGLLIVGFYSLYTSIKYSALRQQAEILRDKANDMGQLYQQFEEQRDIERTLTKHLGPNLPIIQIIHPIDRKKN